MDSSAVFPAGLSAFQLKLFALLVMTLDHIAAYVPLPVPGWFHLAGRLAAPLFLFLCAEGFAHTRSRTRYLGRLYLAFVLMQIGNNQMNHLFMTEGGPIITNGMFGTLFLVVWALLCVELLRSRKPRAVGRGIAGLALFTLSALPLIFLMTFTMDSQHIVAPWARTVVQIYACFIPSPLFCEGGIVWIVLGAAFYFTRRHPAVRAAVYALFCGACAAISRDWLTYLCTFAAIVPMSFYHGAPGQHKLKTFFYLYYPLHVYVLFFLGWLLRTQAGL